MLHQPPRLATNSERTAAMTATTNTANDDQFQRALDRYQQAMMRIAIMESETP
jgi:hypothetical protein